jgi:hypothetical protein
LLDVGHKLRVTNDSVDHRLDFAPHETVDDEGGDVRLSDLRWLEFWPEGYEQRHSTGRDPVHCPTESFQTGGVGPMCILEDHQHRVLPDSTSICAVNASNVLRRRCCESRSSAG